MILTNKSSRRENLRFSNFGFSTILLSFVLICVVSFSALSLMTAYSDYKLSQKVAIKTTHYYEAKEQAFLTLEEIDQLLCEAYLSSEAESDYYANVSTALSSLAVSEGEHRYYFLQPIAEKQNLLVKIRITYPLADEDTFYDIISWQSIYDTVEPEDTYLDLID